MPASFALRYISINAIMKILKSLSKNSKIYLLNIDSKLLYIAAEQIAPHITHLINRSITNNLVPDDMKKARFIPIYKGKGEKCDFSNYRPNSTLSFVAKIMQKTITYYFVNNHRI